MSTFLKRFSLLLALIVFATSCTAIKHIKKVREISADRAIKECLEPKEFFFIPPTSYGVGVRIMRHENCMEIPNMVLSIWFGEKTEINELTARLLALLFIQSKNANNDTQYGHVFLKVDKASDDGPYIIFIELVEVSPEDYNEENNE